MDNEYDITNTNNMILIQYIDNEYYITNTINMIVRATPVCNTSIQQNVRERLAVGKHAAQRLDGQRFNLSKVNDLEVRKQYQIDITNRFAALENLNEDEDVNRRISKPQRKRV